VVIKEARTSRGLSGKDWSGGKKGAAETEAERGVLWGELNISSAAKKTQTGGNWHWARVSSGGQRKTGTTNGWGYLEVRQATITEKSGKGSSTRGAFLSKEYGIGG